MAATVATMIKTPLICCRPLVATALCGAYRHVRLNRTGSNTRGSGYALSRTCGLLRRRLKCLVNAEGLFACDLLSSHAEARAWRQATIRNGWGSAQRSPPPPPSSLPRSPQAGASAHRFPPAKACPLLLDPIASACQQSSSGSASPSPRATTTSPDLHLTHVFPTCFGFPPRPDARTPRPVSTPNTPFGCSSSKEPTHNTAASL